MYYFRSFGFSVEVDESDEVFPNPLLLEGLFALETDLPDLADDEFPEELCTLPFDFEREVVEKDSFPEL
jgi:hypothetical protein